VTISTSLPGSRSDGPLVTCDRCKQLCHKKQGVLVGTKFSCRDCFLKRRPKVPREVGPAYRQPGSK